MVMIPPVKANGTGRYTRSSLRRSRARIRMTAIDHTLPWLSMAPFGRPVVPLV